MGSKQSIERPATLPEQFYCSIDLELLPTENFKVLGCGHYFCRECLDAWADQNLLNCPKCRCEEHRDVDNLHDIHSFPGVLFLEDPPDHEDKLIIHEMLQKQMVRRARTIRILRTVAKEVSGIEITSAGVKIGGAAAGLIGTGMVITGTILSLTGVGAVAGVPLAVAGAAVGGAGGLTVGGGIVGEAIAKSKHLTGANNHLNADFFGSMQLRILVGRASRNELFAKKIKFPAQDAASLVAVLGRIAKFSTATAAFARAIAAGVTRGVANAGLHIAGIVISAVLIPIDIYQLVVSSLKIHHKDKSKVVQDVEKLALELEDELLSILKDKNYQLAEIERFDSETIKHTMLIAIEEDFFVDVVENSNVSYKEIEDKHVVLIDSIVDGIYEDVYSNFITRWEEVVLYRGEHEEFELIEHEEVDRGEEENDEE